MCILPHVPGGFLARQECDMLVTAGGMPHGPQTIGRSICGVSPPHRFPVSVFSKKNSLGNGISSTHLNLYGLIPSLLIRYSCIVFFFV